MRHTLNIQLRTAEGAVLRALGLIERRGFRLETVHAREAQGDGQAMTVTVEGDRPADLLQRQLERLHDVLWVEVGGETRSRASRGAGSGGWPVPGDREISNTNDLTNPKLKNVARTAWRSAANKA